MANAVLNGYVIKFINKLCEDSSSTGSLSNFTGMRYDVQFN